MNSDMFIQSEPDNDKPFKNFCIRRTEWYHGNQEKPYKVRWQAVSRDGEEGYHYDNYEYAVSDGNDRFGGVDFILSS